MLTSGIKITVPEIFAASSVAMSRSTAMIDAYSVPCAPETMVRTGPGFAPRKITTGICVAASTPAGTSMKPMDFWPGMATAVPTVKLFCCARVEAAKNIVEGMITIARNEIFVRRDICLAPVNCGQANLAGLAGQAIFFGAMMPGGTRVAILIESAAYINDVHS